MTVPAAVERLSSRPSLRRRTGAGERRWPLARIFTVGATVVAVVTVTAVVLGALAIAGLTDARTALLDVVAPANLATKDLTAAMLNQETGVRGFVLTGRAESRSPYDAGVEGQRVAETAVRMLAARGGLPGVDADLDALDAVVARWRTAYAVPALAGAAPLVQGNGLFDRVRAAVGTLQSDIDRQRIAGRDRLNAAAGYVTGVGVLIAVVLVVFLTAMAIGLRRGVLRPVSELADQVRAVVAGDVASPVRVDGPWEIAELGEDVEAMRVRIQSDLDAAQRANHRLDDETQKLERSNRDLEQFAYVASHDLQEPLRKVASFCQLLQRRYGGRLDERADQYIAFAVDGAERMQQLINDLLEFSRVGRTTAGFTAVALDDVLASVVTQLDQRRREVDGTIEVAPLPVVSGDTSLLRQLFVNLVGNGLKFHRDGVPPTVRVTARALADDRVEIVVADDGIGIEQAYADKVFVIFQRLHARDVYPGTGIGLALAKKIVEFHGGTITLDAPGEQPGATLRCTFPATPDPAQQEKP